MYVTVYLFVTVYMIGDQNPIDLVSVHPQGMIPHKYGQCSIGLQYRDNVHVVAGDDPGLYRKVC